MTEKAGRRVSPWAWLAIALLVTFVGCETVNSISSIMGDGGKLLSRMRAARNVDRSITETWWEHEYGATRELHKLRQATSDEAAMVEAALGLHRSQGCGAYRVETAARSLRVRCSPGDDDVVIEYLVETHGSLAPRVHDDRMGRAK